MIITVQIRPLSKVGVEFYVFTDTMMWSAIDFEIIYVFTDTPSSSSFQKLCKESPIGLHDILRVLEALCAYLVSCCLHSGLCFRTRRCFSPGSGDRWAVWVSCTAGVRHSKEILQYPLFIPFQHLGPPSSRTKLDGQNWPPSFVMKKLQVPALSGQTFWHNKIRRFSTLSFKTGWQSWGSTLTSNFDEQSWQFWVESLGKCIFRIGIFCHCHKKTKTTLRQLHHIDSKVAGVNGTTNQRTGEFRCRICFWLSTENNFRMHGGWKDQWKNVSRVQEEITRGAWPASRWYAFHKLPFTWRRRAWRQQKWSTAWYNKEGKEKEKRKQVVMCTNPSTGLWRQLHLRMSLW